jgi:hypothetical protein
MEAEHVLDRRTYHPSFQTIAFFAEETGEYGERELNHGAGDAERFYRDLQRQGISDRVAGRRGTPDSEDLGQPAPHCREIPATDLERQFQPELHGSGRA